MEAKSFGAASAEEWIKGLASQGQKRLDDIIRWEQWEYKGGLKKVNIRHHPKIAHSGSTMLAKKNIAPKDDSRLDSSRLQDFALSTTKDDGNFPPNPVLSTDAVTSVHSADKGMFLPTLTIHIHSYLKRTLTEQSLSSADP